MANVSEERKQYMKALEYTDVYEDIMDGIKNPTEEEQELIDRQSKVFDNRQFFLLL